MTFTKAPTVKNQELVQTGLLESASVNSISDFTHEKSTYSKVTVEKEKDDFVNLFICHLIFYVVFCLAIVLHILIDLGLGSFIKTKFDDFAGFRKKVFLNNTPAFA